MIDTSKGSFQSYSDARRFRRPSIAVVIGAWALIILLAAIMFAAYSLTPQADADQRAVLLPALVVVVVSVPCLIWARSWRRGIDVLEPPVFVTSWCLAFYILPTVAWAFGLSQISLNKIIADAPGRWLGVACWATAAGLAAMWAGYLIVTKRKQLAYDPPPSSSPQLRVNLAQGLYIVSVVVRFFLYTYGLRGNAGVFRTYQAGGSSTVAIDQLIDVAVKCLAAVGPALFLFLVASPRLRRTNLAWILLVPFAEIAVGTLSGSRAGVILTVIYFAAYYHYARGKYPNWKLIPMAAVLFALSIPVINQLRSETIQIDRMNPTNFVQTLQTASGETLTMDAASVVEEVRTVAFERQMAVFQMQAAMLRLHPSFIPFTGIDKLLLFPVYLIPRALWPDKPSTFDALETSRIYLGETTTVFSSPILPADLYIMGGWLVLVIGMFIFGLVQGLAYRYLVGSARIINLVLFAMIFFELSHWEGQLSAVLSILLRSVPLFWLFLHFILFRRAHRTAQVQPF